MREVSVGVASLSARSLSAHSLLSLTSSPMRERMMEGNVTDKSGPRILNVMYILYFNNSLRYNGRLSGPSFV